MTERDEESEGEISETEQQGYGSSDDDAFAADGAEAEDAAAEEDESDEDLEDMKDYKKGGYHPVVIGESFSEGRYNVLSKLGWGHFSTVWLAWDHEGARAVTLKVQKSATRYSEAARDEVELLRTVSRSEQVGDRCLVLLTDHFVHRGVNGTHHVMAFEVLGPTLLSLIRQTDYQGLPLPVVRRVASCVLLACAHLHHNLSIIHTDLKPENILCEYTPQQLDALVAQAHAEAAAAIDAKQAKQRRQQGGDDGDADVPDVTDEAVAATAGGAGSSSSSPASKKKGQKKGSGGGSAHGAAVAADGGARYEPRLKMQRPPAAQLAAEMMRFKVVDLGNSCWRDRHFTSDIQTRQYRCPEVILGAGYDISADVWSIACVLFEAATGDLLFSPKAGATWSRDEDHLALIQELVGKLPRKLALAGKHSKEFFTSRGELRNIKDLRFWSLESVLASKYELPSETARDLAAFLVPMLDLDPNKRAAARHLAHHPWLSADATHVASLARLGLTEPPAGMPDWAAAAHATAARLEAAAAALSSSAAEAPAAAAGAEVPTGAQTHASKPKPTPLGGGALGAAVVAPAPPRSAEAPSGVVGFALAAPSSQTTPSVSHTARQPAKPVVDARGRVFHQSTGPDGPGAVVAYYWY